jgi:hypothetical protein
LLQVTDLDSVAGAIGAAALYGGKAATASEVNSETEFALKQWGGACFSLLSYFMRDGYKLIT